LQAGVRFDNASVVGSTISPRFNASMEIIPNKLSIFGGYGVTAKMPTLLYLYPENAYFEYTNLNELDNTKIAEAERKYITTTRVFEVDNSDLEITKNYKAEAGFKLNLGKVSLNVTGYHERLKNGYTMGQTLDTYKSVNWTTYKFAKNLNGYLSSTLPVLSYFNAPTNNMNVEIQVSNGT
jgi:outer membrane cobalamin receptor